MTEKQKVVVIGATGNVGPHAVSQLLEKGVETRALTLPDDPKINRLEEGVEVFHGDLSDPDSLDRCLEGATSVFLMWPFFTLDVETVPDVLKRIKQHTEKVVFVSSIGVQNGIETVDNRCHAFVEREIERLGMEWTFLRTTGFCCNAGTGWAHQIRSEGVVRSPYGNATRSPIHEADLAAVAVRALTEEGHSGQRYVVTGPEALSQIEQLRIISEVSGREARWVDVPHESASTNMIESGWPAAYAEGALEYFAILTKEPERVTSTVEEVLERPARTFRQWSEENSDLFR
ncbi:Uncharacterized conserved protein YbjT, contains NAD(P)-binding and DUF2867 domains [Actinopolyspora mzabensis]|uniref:Uncharacterized conserved protein YbjT, contains NAD(P)-binding and DUF2867 domains n=2 Tax=Actinopolyspora mzabensis TaxID=995066 RepID=A0A1G8ZB45_ACTMZ|nr:Uncharacterized conserved protein YbjT, contains NAD(P)-binding and DUF2867 domains [Actinopolyspora mzabensis]